MNEACDTVYISELAELFTLEHTLILTPNQRLAQQIQQQGDHIEQLAGAKSWSARPVMAVSNWLQQLWDSATAAGLKPCSEHWVLSAGEELEIWRKAMLDTLNTEFIAPESAAQQLMQAWQLLCDWHVDIGSSTLRSRFQLNDNCAFFLKVCERVLGDCHQIRALCSAQMPLLLAELKSPLTGTVLLYGFEELLPAHQHLFKQWHVNYTAVQLRVDKDELQESTQLIRAPTFEAEILAAAQWAHSVVSNDETARVAVIVPQLETRRAQLEHGFENVFTPQAANPYVKRQVNPFNISAGVSLAGTPLVQSALRLLNLIQRPIPSMELPELFYSPFYAHSYSLGRTELYQLEHRLRGSGDSEMSLGTIVREAQYLLASGKTDKESGNGCVSLLLQGLSDCRRISRDQDSMLFDDHLQTFTQQLAAVGWPGERSSDSVEYQQLNAFTTAINQSHMLAQLRFGARKKVSSRQSLRLLEHVLRMEVFQAQTDDTRVQVLGLLEGAGLPFTHVRLCDFSLGQWPANPRPSAYIPYLLQRELRMPHCDARREADFSKRLFQRYQHQAHSVSCSYAVDDGSADVLPSTLLKDMAIDELEISVPESGVDSITAAVNDSVEPLPVATAEDIRATTSLLTDQAACPFKAFMRHRLNVRRLEPARLGIDGRERGIILHDAMEAFWRETAEHSTLVLASERELRERINQAIGIAIAAAKRRLTGREAHGYLGIEAIRLNDIMFDWLRNEAQRSPFRVTDLEYAFDTEIAGRPAQLRIDRVDLLEDGSLVLLEYKSGTVSEKETMQQPLLAPQLALYLLRYRAASGQHACGGAICKIDSQASTWIAAGGAKFTGMPLQRRLSKPEQDEENRAELWAEQLQLWEREIQGLEHSFLAGEAKAEPAKGAQTCRQCDYASICRYAIDGAGV